MNRALLGGMLLLGFVSTAAAAEVVITTADGKVITASLIAADAQNVKYLPTGSTQPAFLPLSQLAVIQIQKPPAPPRESKYDAIELTDGTMILASQVVFRSKSVLPTLLTNLSGVVAPVVELPMKTVAHWMRNAHDARLRDEWGKLVAERVKKDRVVLRQADGYEVLAGTLLDATESGDAIAFDQDGVPRRNLPTRRMTGGFLVYQSSTDILPPTLCKVSDQFGNKWIATRIEIVGAGLKLTTVCGAVVNYATLDALVTLDFAKGNVMYLSDLTPTVVYPEADEAKSMGAAFGLARRVVMDRAGGGQDLMAHGKRYAKGLAIPKETSCSFRIDGSYREMKFLLAAVPRGEQTGLLLPMTILVDDKTIFTVAAGDVPSPTELAFNVKDAKEIRFVVGSRGFDGDRQLLLDARLQK